MRISRLISRATMMSLAWLFTAGAQNPRGLIEPENDILMSAPIPGRVAVIHFREGDRVEKGALILSMDAQLEELEVERRKLVFEDRAELEAALAREKIIAQDLEAARSLFERTRSVSREELSKKELEHKLAGLDIARLQQAKTREEVEYMMAQEQRNLRQLKAPFDGVVADVYFDEGESVQANQPMLRLVSDERCYLVLNVPNEELANRTVGEPARIRAETNPPTEKDGQLDFISPLVDAASGLRKVKIVFENKSPRIEPGIPGLWLLE